MRAETKSLYLPSVLRGRLPRRSKTHFGFSSHGENHFPFNPLSFLIHAAQIRCFHTAESDVRGSPRRRVLECRLETEDKAGTRGLVVIVK